MSTKKTALSFGWLFALCTAHGQSSYEVLVNSRGTNAVFRYDLEGNCLGEFIASGSGGLVGPEDVLFHPDGTVLVTGFGNTAIKRYDGSTGDYLGDFSTGYDLEVPSKMSIGLDSLLYVTQWGTTQNKVVRFDLDGVFVDEFTEVATPNGLGHFWDDQGRFYISVYGNGANGFVRRFTAGGEDLGVFINSTVLQGPTDLWQEENGDVLVQDWTTGTVLRYDSTGAYVGVFVSGLTNPEGLAFLPDGDLLMGDWGVEAVHRISPDGAVLGYFASGNGLTDPNGVFLRAVPTIGIDEDGTCQMRILASPAVGPGPFEIRGLPMGTTAFTVLDATGRTVDAMIGSPGTSATLSWEPGPSFRAGVYRIVVRSEGRTAGTSVVLVR